MIVCPNCKHEENDGAIFCSDCGTQLIQVDTSKTQQIEPDLSDLTTAPIRGDFTHYGVAWISLHLLDSGQILPVADRTEFTLGRISDNQPIMPDIDLTPYKAYDNGVSRLHAVVRLTDGIIKIMDLGSANGTYINGTRIMPNVEQTLRHGDVIALGKLKIQVVFS